MHIKCHAKINIGLAVKGRRADGFHDIESLFATVSLSDELEIEPAESYSLESDDCSLDCSEANLVTKAALALSARTGKRVGARAFLKKSIPEKAGLGGGSSDCAAALLGFNKILGLNLGREELKSLAAGLGSDVPFFLEGGFAMCRGRGEEVSRLDSRLLDAFECVLVMPGFPISTKEAYASLGAGARKEPDFASFLSALASRECEGLQGMLFNDFEPFAYSRCPELADIKTALLGSGALYASLSGTGSAVYGLYRRGEGEKAARIFAGIRTACCLFVA
ncbi:MAG: 4-(cytidine 5'-diphospho)-2-C-methyl-D-erythritol kinase [Eubacteriaceae bacterium]|jgi:4-diphosphocytidyl-2-C-methyl-D-erythritol kinase|nr:4-(cytidine 5'-diphospho)-2-C-methyl-D-erythritol kinase [Eubacteriaceae bacterium]